MKSVKKKFYTRFDLPDIDFGFKTEGESMTLQSEAESCDINKIMERFDRTGQLPVSMKAPPVYGDARIYDFQTAKQIVIEAQNQFNELSAEARKYFGHDPQNMLQALADAYKDPDKAKKLLDLGILVQKEEAPEATLQRIAKNTEKVENNAVK